MKKIVNLVFLLLIFSCVEDKYVLLPEIENASITDIKDVSPAYLFYNLTKPDSVELNRKNLIITTNWLVNIDKRLTLKQILPSVMTLQNKKRTSDLHKNESARNYYTCNDTSIKNLGFIDFTDVIYIDDFKKVEVEPKNRFNQLIFTKEHIKLINSNTEIIENDTNDLKQIMSYLIDNKKTNETIFLNFKSDLAFQDYIKFKNKLLTFNNFKISNYEIILD